MKPNTFLLVDDNPSTLNELNALVKYIQCEKIDPAANGHQAWKLLKKNVYDCIITSWEMQEMTGLALLKLVRKEEKHQDTPFFLTHDAFTKLKVIQAGQAGVTGLIVRPFDLETLTIKIEQIAHGLKEPEILDKEKKYQEGLQLIEKKQYDQALILFESLIKTSESAEYYYNIGFIKTSQAKYPEALAAFQKATQLDHLFVKAFIEP